MIEIFNILKAIQMMLNDYSRDSVCAWTPCVSSISISFKHEGRRCVFVFLIWLSIDPERDVFSPRQQSEQTDGVVT